jgi:NTE family protein
VTRNTDHELLEDLPIPLHVIACDVHTGEEVRLSAGPLAEAVMASAAIPGVLPPVEWEGRLLMDGGVVDNTPISHALELGADHVYVLPTGGPCELLQAPRGALGMLVHASTLMVAQRFAGEAAAFAGRDDVTILPPPCPIDVQPMDFGQAGRLMDGAQADACAFLDARALPNLRAVCA